jgi:hypothetical protein
MEDKYSSAVLRQYFRDLTNEGETPKNRVRMDSMTASSSTCGFSIPVAVPNAAASRGPKRRRRISSDAGRALEVLGHAIEYLTDEFIYSGGSFSARNGQVEAIQLLMGANRQIYFACPEVPTIGERFRALLHPRPA